MTSNSTTPTKAASNGGDTSTQKHKPASASTA